MEKIMRDDEKNVRDLEDLKRE